MSNPIDLFDSITIDTTSNIPKEDKDYCTSKHNEYRKIYDNVLKDYNTIKLLNEYDKLPDNLTYSINYKKDHILKEVLESLVNVNRGIVYLIVMHFNSKYTLGIKVENIYSCLKYCQFDAFKEGNVLGFTNADEILNIISELCPDLEASGKEYIINTFRGYFYRADRLKLQNKKISLQNFFYNDEDRWNKAPDIIRVRDRDSKKIRFLEKAVFLIKHNKLPDDTFCYYIEPNAYYSMDLSKSKIYGNEIKYKFFKNGKVEIIFENKEQAHSFWNLYDLSNIGN